MDSSHVSLCALLMRAEAFDHFRCDRDMSLGLNFPNLSKILKCAGNDDIVTLKSNEGADSLTLVFESAKQDRISDFDMKLMQIDSEHLGIPETEYVCTIRLPSSEFQRIMRDLTVLGDTCKYHSLYLCLLLNFEFTGTIACTKEGVRFSSSGDLGTGNILLKHNPAVDKEDEAVVIDMQEPVELLFALRYLNLFTKATPLGPTVTLSLSPDLPILVEYPVGDLGYVRYYLAPKIDEDA
jgi:proliferating cell nuclear antigen